MLAAQQVAHGIDRVHAHQHRLRPADIALNEGQMLDAIDLALIGHHAPDAAGKAGNLALLDALDQPLGTAAMGDQVRDGAELDVMALGEGDQIRQAGHGAVIVHDLADHAGGGEPGQAGDVHRSLGMAGAHQRAAIARHQREYMAGGDDILTPELRIDRNRDGPRAVGGGNAGGDPLARLDRNREGGLMPGAVGLAHQRQAEALAAVLRHGEADQPARMLGHEVDRIRGCELRRDHEVALVLAVLVIDQDEDPPCPRFLDNFGGRGDVIVQASRLQCRLQTVHQTCPFMAGA